MKRLVTAAAGLLAAAALAGPARLDAGGAGGRYGVAYEADREYTAANGAGAIGGTPQTPPLVTSGQVIENTAYTPLLNSVRDGVSEYRFDLANGSYLLTLQFVELVHNGPGLRRFSVQAEGRTLLADLDLYARFGRNYAVTYQFAVTVADGQLNVSFPASAGSSTVAAIGVQAVAPPARGPRTPGGVTARGGFYRNIVAWPDSTEPLLAGYLVSRAPAAAGPYTVLTPEPIPASRHFDDAVTPFTAAHYRVASVDVFGNRSGFSAPVAAAPLDRTQTALPVYRLVIPPDQLAILQANPESDYVTADFIAGGTTYAGIGVRYRGGSTRQNHKKSWKVNFKKSAPFEGRDKLNLKALGLDTSLLTECAAADQLRQGSTLTGDCSFAYLEVNGEYMGVFSRLEEVDDDFFARRGLTPGGQMLEAEGPGQANFQVLPDYSVVWDDQSANDDGYPALEALVRVINDTPDASFPGVIAGQVNVDAWIDYYVAMQLISDWDHVSHNYHIYRSPDSPLWEVVPKDFDQAFGNPALALLQGVKTSPRQPPASYNLLTSRLLNVPLFRQWYVDKANALMAASYTPARLAAVIDAGHAAVQAEARVDTNKRFREDNVAFDGSDTVLKDFVAQRIAFVRANLPGLTPGVAPPVLINEVLPDNRNGLVNGAGLRSPWVELHNPRGTAWDLGGHGLTNDPAVPLRWRFPAGTVLPPGGHLLVWLDGATVPGELHAPLAISARGQALALYAPDGSTLLDTIGFRALPADTSYGRRASGSALWGRQAAPTPRAPNTGP